VLDETISPELSRYKVLRGVLYTSGTVLSFASCIVPSYISWRYDRGKPGIQILETAGIVGVAIDFGIFGAYGYVLISRIFVNRLSKSREHHELFKENASLLSRVVHISLSTLWGSSSRLTMIGLGIKFASSFPLGLAGAIGGAGPALWSAFQTIRHVIDKTKADGFFCSAEERKLRKIKKELLACLATCRQAVLKMPREVRNDCLPSLFQSARESGSQEALAQIQEVFTEIVEVQRGSNLTPESCLIAGPRYVVKVAMVVPPTMLLLQLWLLANTAMESICDNPWANSITVTVAVSAFVFLAYSENQNGAEYLYNRTVKLIAPVRGNVTEVEVVFGRLSYLIDILGLGLALMPYADLVSISEQYAAEDTMFTGTTRQVMDNTFIYGSYAGWVMLIFQSVRKLLIARAARSYATRESSSVEMRRDAVILQKLEHLEGIIQESNLTVFKQFLADLPATMSAMTYQLSEETPLLQNA
jgi:hypothetical protein